MNWCVCVGVGVAVCVSLRRAIETVGVSGVSRPRARQHTNIFFYFLITFFASKWVGASVAALAAPLPFTNFRILGRKPAH